MNKKGENQKADTTTDFYKMLFNFYKMNHYFCAFFAASMVALIITLESKSLMGGNGIDSSDRVLLCLFSLILNLSIAYFSSTSAKRLKEEHKL